jgi:hypothetical protein
MLERKQYWVVGLITAVLSFVALYVGIRVVSANAIAAQNIMAHIIFSVLLGIIAGVLVFFRLKISFLTYIAGVLLGFIFMYKAFLYDMTGWEDLIGVLSLLIFTVSGLILGLLAQLVYYLYKRYKKS